MNRIIICSAFIFLVTLAGCSSFNTSWKKHLPWSPESRLKSSKFQTPTRMISIWTPDILTQPGKPSTRGFGGRLYFYNEKSQAIPVEGQLIVYAYDDTVQEHPPGEPNRKYAFTPDQFTKHFSTSDLGASYSIWLPWDAVGGEQRSVSLVPVFTASAGQIVMGQQTVSILPGKKTDAAVPQEQPLTTPLPSPLAVQAASHNDQPLTDRAADSQTTSRMRTATINVPRGMQLRLMKEPPLPRNRSELTPKAIPNVDGNWGVIQTSNQGSEPSAPSPRQEQPKVSELPVIQQAAPLAQLGPRQPAIHFERPRFPVREALAGPTGPAAGPWPRSLATQPFVQPSSISPIPSN